MPGRAKPNHCASGRSCVNPDNGQLQDKDYAYNKNGRLNTCKLCHYGRKRNTFSVEEVVNSSLEQQFICGMIGHAPISYV